MLDLKGYTAREGCDCGFSVVEGFRDFDFEAFAGRELEDEFGVC